MYCPYGLRCQFAHSLRSFNKPEGEEKPQISYSKILEENVNQMMLRVKTLENPDLQEFNTVYKEMPRLSVFAAITQSSSATEEASCKTNKFNPLQKKNKTGSSKGQSTENLEIRAIKIAAKEARRQTWSKKTQQEAEPFGALDHQGAEIMNQIE